MRKETLITAIVFFGVGLLAGYILAAHQRSEMQQASLGAAAPAAAQDMAGLPPGHPPINSAMPGASQNSQNLPPGHPAVNSDSMIEALKDAAEKNPQDPQAPLRLANVLYDQQRFQEAVEWYQKALKLDPSNADARTDLGTAYFNLGKPREALREYRQALQVKPDHQPTLFNSIIVNLEGIHDLRAARAAWEHLHRLNPGYPGLDHLKEQLDTAQGAGAAKP